jgi:hypothetical protein
MSEVLPIVYLARHGETAWTLSGQHTGLTDLPLTKRGERNARRLEERLRGVTFAKVFTSPLQRATRTCELAGFRAVAEIDRDLLEWNYGEYEEDNRPIQLHPCSGLTAIIEPVARSKHSHEPLFFGARYPLSRSASDHDGFSCASAAPVGAGSSLASPGRTGLPGP